jgi:DNA-3-methyladenine glycosylase I
VNAAAGTGPRRCGWADGGDPLYATYHDAEWGRPVLDDTRLFEKLCLEGFQAGLSWLTILRKREAFRAAFAGFDPERVARFDDDDIERLVTDAGIVRHRGKITSAIGNAQRARDLQVEAGSIAAYVWSFEPDDRPMPTVVADIPSITPESKALSRDLKRRGWTFVGPTTVYAFMQAMGLVNDHVEGCWVRTEVEAERSALARPIRRDG